MGFYKIGDLRPTQAVILCGGLGTRMRPYTYKMPKPMVPCNGKPFLWHLLKQLNEQGFLRFVLLTGYLADQIYNYFNDGSNWGWQIKYCKGPVEWDTGRRIWEARNHFDLRFLLLYSDNFVTFHFSKLFELHERNGLPLTLTASPKSPGNIDIDDNGIVTRFDKNRDNKLCYVEIGYMVVEKLPILERFKNIDCNFSEIIKSIAPKRQISAWIHYDSYHSISDAERWKKTEEYLKPKKIILIDRDGVINRKAAKGEYITSWEEFEWITETKKIMKQLALEGFRFIVISNQAGISRGKIDLNKLEQIHRNMTHELSKDGVEILDIYFCPHHWDDDCACRKPNPGMLYKASREHLFRLDKTLLIGDDQRDCQTAFNAGCRSIFIGNANELSALPYNCQPDCIVSGLGSSLDFIRKYFNKIE